MDIFGSTGPIDFGFGPKFSGERALSYFLFGFSVFGFLEGEFLSGIGLTLS